MSDGGGGGQKPMAKTMIKHANRVAPDDFTAGSVSALDHELWNLRRLARTSLTDKDRGLQTLRQEGAVSKIQTGEKTKVVLEHASCI